MTEPALARPDATRRLPGHHLPAGRPPARSGADECGRRSVIVLVLATAVTLLAPLVPVGAASGLSAVTDGFSRSVQDGLGRTDSGQPWRLDGAARQFAVADGRAQFRLSRAGTGATSWVDGARGTDTDVRVRVQVDERQTGRGTYASVLGRRVAGGDYRLRLRFLPGGDVLAALVRTLDGREKTLASRSVPGVEHRPGQDLDVRLEVLGTSPATVRAKVWRAGSRQPGWLVRAQDGSASLQRAGAVGLAAYVSSSATNAPEVVAFDRLSAVVGHGKAAEPDDPAPTPPPAGGRPGPGNTGVPDGLRLTRHGGDLVITKDGARYDRLDVHGFVIVRADDVRITRSRVRGRRATGSIGLVTNYAGARLVVEDSTLAPQSPSVHIDGLKGSHFTARRVDVHSTTDNVKVHGNDVRVESSWLHDAAHWDDDPHQGGRPSHNDGVQVLGGKNIRIVRNTITGANNAALQVTQDYSATRDLHFTGNWADGGGCTVNLAHKPKSSMSGITVNGNRFGRNTRFEDCAILTTRRTELQAEGNVWQDDGRPVRIRRTG